MNTVSSEIIVKISRELFYGIVPLQLMWPHIVAHEKKIGHRDCSPWAHGELTVSSRWPKWAQPVVTEPWPGPWLSCDLAVTEPWSYWRCRDWAVTSPWLSCDLAVTELWHRRDWAVTSPSRDWAVIIGPGAVTTVVTVSSRWAHRELTVTIFFLMGETVVQSYL